MCVNSTSGGERSLATPTYQGRLALVFLPLGAAVKLGRLFQGICEHKGTDTCFFIKKLDVPKGRTYTYGRIVCNYCPQKDKSHRTWLAKGGDCIGYPWKKSTPTADLTTAKLLFNSTISTPSTSFYGIDLANFYLNTPMER